MLANSMGVKASLPTMAKSPSAIDAPTVSNPVESRPIPMLVHCSKGRLREVAILESDVASELLTGRLQEHQSEFEEVRSTPSSPGRLAGAIGGGGDPFNRQHELSRSAQDDIKNKL